MHTKPKLRRARGALAISAVLGLALPLTFSSAAWAAEGSAVRTVAFDSFTWVADRKLPAAVDVTATTLTMEIDGTQQSPNAHEQWEGVRTAVPAGTPWVDRVDSVQATLTVDATWTAIADVNAGIWLESAHPAGSAWPTLEVVNSGGSMVAEVFDTFTNTVQAVTPVSPGQVKLEIAVNPMTSEFEYFVNGTRIFSHAAVGYSSPSTVLFNSFNPGGTGANDYTVVWSDLQFGTKIAAPTITTTSLPAVSGDGTYSATVVATSDTPASISPFVFSVASGTLPPGLSLNPSTGVISGKTTEAGTYDFTISVTNGSGLVDTAQLQIVVPSGLALAESGLDTGAVIIGSVGGGALVALGLAFVVMRRRLVA